MKSINYKYDVAFSFLQEDEGLAIKINDLFEGRLSAFLYSNKQNEIAGKDGEEKFNQVFGKEARVVVVLYKSSWGSTPWTRIEENAIRSRAYDEGYDFVIFIVLSKRDELPKWLPKTRIWSNFERFGIEGAVSVIESKVQEAGGESREESLTTKAQRFDREIKAEQERKSFLNSTEGVKAAKEEVASLFVILNEISSQIMGAAPAMKFTVDDDGRTCVIYAPGFSLLINWYYQYANTLNYSGLHVRLFRGAVSFKDRRAWEEPAELSEEKFEFDLNQLREKRWRKEGNNSRLYTTKELGELCMTKLMQKLKEKEFADADD